MKSDKTTDLLTEVAVIDSDPSLSDIQVVLSAQLKSMSGLCWHSRLPLVAIATDQRLILFLIDNV